MTENVHRIITHEFPRYFALVSRPKVQYGMVGPTGGNLSVMASEKEAVATFPEQAGDNLIVENIMKKYPKVYFFRLSFVPMPFLTKQNIPIGFLNPPAKKNINKLFCFVSWMSVNT